MSTTFVLDSSSRTICWTLSTRQKATERHTFYRILHPLSGKVSHITQIRGREERKSWVNPECSWHWMKWNSIFKWMGLHRADSIQFGHCEMIVTLSPTLRLVKQLFGKVLLCSGDFDSSFCVFTKRATGWVADCLTRRGIYSDKTENKTQFLNAFFHKIWVSLILSLYEKQNTILVLEYSLKKYLKNSTHGSIMKKSPPFGFIWEVISLN